jgi:uncharacterized protein (DUF952 family)
MRALTRRMSETIAYKVMTADDFAVLEAGAFLGSPVDLADGFIHLSTAAQIGETVDRHFSGQTGLIVAAIDLRTLGDAVRWEPSRHGQLFPHVYASLTPRVVLAFCPLERRDGAVRLPA